MYIPEYMLYEVKAIRKRLTDKVTGTLDVYSAIQGRSQCWISSDPSGEQRQKTIILNDFRLASTLFLPENMREYWGRFSSDNAALFIKALKYILNAGFEIYIKQSDGIKAISLTDMTALESESERRRCTPSTKQAVVQAAALRGLSKDRVEIVNLNGIITLYNEMISERELPKQHHNQIEALDIYSSRFNIKEIADSFDSDTEIFFTEIERLYREQALKRYIQDYGNLKAKKIVEYNDYEPEDVVIEEATVVIAGAGVSDLLTKAKKANKLALSVGEKSTFADLGLDPDRDCFPLITHITLDEESLIRFDHSEEVNLKDLKIIFPNASFKFEMNFTLNQIDLDEIEDDQILSHYRFFKETIDTEAIGEVLSKNNHIEHVLIDNCTASEDTSEAVAQHPKILTNELTISGENNHQSRLISCFKASSLGITLDGAAINDNTVLPDTETYYFPEECQPDLRCLKLKSTKDEVIDLNALHQFAPNIESFHLSAIDVTNYNTSYTFIYNERQLNFKSLRTFSLDKGCMVYESLARSAPDTYIFLNIFSFMPNIESLTLNMNVDINILESFRNLKKLRSIRLLGDANADFSNIDPAHILNQFPHLEELTVHHLSGHIFDSMDMIPNRLELTTISLKGFDKNNSVISSPGLTRLMICSPKLVTLNLECFNELDNLFTAIQRYGYIVLENLQHVNLMGSKITLTELEALLKMAPNLKSIKVSLTEQDAKLLYKILPSHIDTKIDITQYMRAHTDETRQNLDSPKSDRSAAKSSFNQHMETSNTDFNTRDPNQSYNIKNVFYGIRSRDAPPCNHYRINVFDNLDINPKNTKHPFRTNNKKSQLFKLYTEYQYGTQSVETCINQHQNTLASTHAYIGVHKMQITGNFHPLPSLYPNELLQAIDIEGIEKDNIEIAYSERDHLYYIKTKDGSSSHTEIKFVIIKPDQMVLKKQNLTTLDSMDTEDDIITRAIKESEINVLTFLIALGHDIKSNFTAGELYLPNNSKPENILEIMYQQKKGVCRHRAIVFMDQYNKHLDRISNHLHTDMKLSFKTKLQEIFNVRIIENDIHAFVEYRTPDGQWVQLDLGGSISADATVDDSANPFETSRVISDDSISSESNELNHSPFSVISDDTESSQQQEPLILESLDKRYVTWVTGFEHNIAKSPAGIALEVLGHQSDNVLLTCEENKEVTEMMLVLQHVAKNTGRPIFVINSPEDVECAGQWLKRDTKFNVGKLVDGPGGRLHDFLTMHQNSSNAVLLINWNNFSPDELVRYNSLIDASRSADGTPLPKNTTVVGIYNTKKPNTYTGSDFFSRNNVKIPLKLDDPQAAEQPVKRKWDLHIPIYDTSADAVSIELHNSLDWKALLLGCWTLQGEQPVFIEGPLTVALKTGQKVHLKNAPWKLPDFKRFWQEAMIHGTLEIEGEIIEVPEDFWSSLTQSTGYHFEPLLNDVTFSHDLATKKMAIPINPGNLYRYFDHYDVQNNTLIHNKSYFAQFENQSLDLIFTRPIDLTSWVKILEEANKYHVSLCCRIPKHIDLPTELRDKIQFNVAQPTASRLTMSQQEVPDLGQVSVIKTTHIPTTLDDIKQQISRLPNSATDPIISQFGFSPLVIDVSEMDETDLFKRVEGSKINNQLVYHESYSEVWQQLRAGQTVILKGSFKNSLKDYLSDHCLYSSNPAFSLLETQFSGRLIVISEDDVSPAFQAIEQTPNVPTEKPASLSLVIGASTEASQSSAPILSSDMLESVAIEFKQNRLKLLNQILKTEPFAYIAGKTGVGKSTFIEKVLTPENGCLLFHEMHSIHDWATNSDPNMSKVLFLDEANISDQDYTIFEGLYEDPPHLLINHKIVPLTKDHKVIFAGNPLSYGGERRLPKFVADHGNACVFDPLPPEVIYFDILKPIFDAKGLNPNLSLEISKCILQTYCYICAGSQSEILISPRELKLMAMEILTLDNLRQPEAIEDIVYNVAVQCLTEDVASGYTHWFRQNHRNANSIDVSDILQNDKNVGSFTLTPSRAPIVQALDKLLKVRHQCSVATERVLQTTGLGGLLLEGEPGTGKSDLLCSVLFSNGFEIIKPPKQHEPVPTLDSANAYYYIPASLSFEEKRRIFLTAFEQGAIVVTDEINSGPMMEQLMNALLMGQHPDTKQPPDKPGFLLLATQNPITMSGREATSHAIRHRMLFYNVPEYTSDELFTILSRKFTTVDYNVITANVASFLESCAYAKQHHLEPQPVFRDLYHIIQKIDRTNQNRAQPYIDQSSNLITTTTVKADDKMQTDDTPVPTVDEDEDQPTPPPRKKLRLSYENSITTKTEKSDDNNKDEDTKDIPRPRKRNRS